MKPSSTHVHTNMKSVLLTNIYMNREVRAMGDPWYTLSGQPWKEALTLAG